MCSICLSASVCCALALPTAIEVRELHPRPDWVRAWVSLDGDWRFDFDPEDVGIRERWFERHEYTRNIRVPFPWQSELSGVCEPQYQGAAWYEREVQIPEDAGPRVFMVFGAIDWSAKVWVNGELMAEHEGGYTPFELELTKIAKPGDTVRVTVRSFDDTDRETPNGKQTDWYTPTGGIWQPVYLESRGNSFLRRTQIVPDVDGGKAQFATTVYVDSPGIYELRVKAQLEGSSQLLESSCRKQLAPGEDVLVNNLSIPKPTLWSPESPKLYDAEISLVAVQGKDQEIIHDRVGTYFGMRKVTRGKFNGSEYEYILLNDKPVYLRGTLHQSFTPEGIYAYPSADYIRRDYEKAKELGLNCVRIHIKVDDPRCLYWADRLGVLLMCDMPNYQRHTPRSQQLWESTVRAAIERDFNHPSIFAWICFNETWGIGDGGYDRSKQEWVREMYLLTKQLDPTRLVEDNSPCNYDHVETDINSWHFYLDKYEAARDHILKVVENTYPGSTFNYAEGWKQGTAPLMNSEYGSVSAGSGDQDISWGFLFLTNLLRRHEKIVGYIYTELEDIEWEHNGFLNYNRSEKEFHYPANISVADLQQPDFPVLDVPPYTVLPENGRRFELPVLLSHWSEKENLVLRLTAHGETVEGQPWSNWVKPQEKKVDARPYAVVPQGSFEIEVPDRKGLLFLVVEVLENNKRVGANYCVLNVKGEAFAESDSNIAIPIRVNKFTNSGFKEVFSEGGKDKVWAYGNGFLEYRIGIPTSPANKKIKQAWFLAEIGSKADAERLDWPARRKPEDYPQTDGKKWPTDIVVALNEGEFYRGTIGDDYADARGVLSHVAHFHPGSHGEVIKMKLNDKALAQLQKAFDETSDISLKIEVPPNAKNKGGIALYGENMGMFPLNPTLLVEFE